MNEKRPVFLNLLQIRLPAPGIASILHRISGVLLFLAIPVSLWLLQASLSGAARFDQVVERLHHPLAMLLVLALLWALAHHLLAGIRFLLLDLDIGLERRAAARSAWLVMAGAPLLALALMLRLYL